ncbi:hypothetical protein EGR_06316 [Echinococcus granulosus]|uniref:Uncharacterized protein n=1 Tax=Echinococcus granulosus TaxID=6210 RepID=W6UKZ6_ECHGR|nr:hypothetical protein EGR_06316 [Echinococcus granulosus]EUB58767.1 hypothetical protein EGR_06316 [Echinococcus granulosus]
MGKDNQEDAKNIQLLAEQTIRSSLRTMISWMYRRPVKKGSLPAYWSRKALQHEYQLSRGTGKARKGEASEVTYDSTTQQPQKATKFKTPYSGSLLLTSKLDEPTLSLPLYFKRLKVNLLSSKNVSSYFSIANFHFQSLSSSDGGFNLDFAILAIICLFVILLNHSRNQFQDAGVRNLPSSDVKASKALPFLLLTSSFLNCLFTLHSFSLTRSLLIHLLC